MLRHGKIVLGDPPKDYDNPYRKFKQWHTDSAGELVQGEVNSKGNFSGKGVCIYKERNKISIGYWKNNKGHGPLIRFFDNGITEIGTRENRNWVGQLITIDKNRKITFK